MTHYPQTPLELMKSRYNAFVALDGEYLAKTTTQKTSTDMSAYENIEWIKLDIIDSYDNIVEFKTYFKEDGILNLLHEKSSFIKEDGMWKYNSGEIFNSKIQRNEICPCGSGRKYKKCCMKS